MGVNTFAYASGTAAGTALVPAGARVKQVLAMTGEAAAGTVYVAGGTAIVLPAVTGSRSTLDLHVDDDAAEGADVVFTGSIVTYTVTWAA